MGYDSFYTVINLGTLFVAFIALLILPVTILLILQPFRYRSKYIMK